MKISGVDYQGVLSSKNAYVYCTQGRYDWRSCLIEQLDKRGVQFNRGIFERDIFIFEGTGETRIFTIEL